MHTELTDDIDVGQRPSLFLRERSGASLHSLPLYTYQISMPLKGELHIALYHAMCSFECHFRGAIQHTSLINGVLQALVTITVL